MPMSPQRDRPRGWTAQPLHPLLLAAFPVLFLFAENAVQQVTLDPLWLPLGASVAGAVFALAAGAALLRDWRRGALVAGIAVVLFFSFGHAWNIARESYGLSDRTPLALAYAGVGLATLLLAWRGGRWVVPVTRAANVVAVLLVAFNVVRVGQFAIGSVVVLPAATASAAPMATAAWDVEALHRRYPDGPEQLRREGLDARAKVSEMVRIQRDPAA